MAAVKVAVMAEVMITEAVTVEAAAATEVAAGKAGPLQAIKLGLNRRLDNGEY
jgi:hypothetical protein